MFSKPIFKQSIQANWKLWVIITAVASFILSGFIIRYDPSSYASIAAAAEGTAFASVLSSLTSLLGSLENFYRLIAVILGIVYVVFTANNLVVNEVDSGSMAYTLSTPIRRSSVIFTKSLYLILSVIVMYIIIAIAGLGSAHFTYNNVTGYAITEDIAAAAEALNLDDDYVSERLYLIQDDEYAMREAAIARHMDTEAYSIYLEEIIYNRSYEEAADIITDERYDFYEDDEDMEDEDIEITAEELMEQPKMILTSNDALIVGARVFGISVNDYNQFIADEIAALENIEAVEPEAPNQPNVQITEDNAELLLSTVIDLSAAALGVNNQQVQDNLALLKDERALTASTEGTGLQEQQITMMANHAMVSAARSEDNALEFDTEAYFWLSIGLVLLILALSSISFFASTFFNKSGLALALGGGIPFAFFLITMIQQLMEDADNLKYVTITTLFDTEAIIAGGDFGLGLMILGAISVVLYGASNLLFTKKDLPL